MNLLRQIEVEFTIGKAPGYENTHMDEIWLDEYSDVGPFVFDAKPYERILLQGMNLLVCSTI